MQGKHVPLGERLALNKQEAARILGVSVDFFDAHVAREVKVVRRGRRAMYPRAELDRWLRESAERIFDAFRPS